MISSPDSRMGLIHECVVDLRNNGIDLAGAEVGLVEEVVRQHLDYFQMMLGYEPDEGEVVSLIQQDTDGGTVRRPSRN